MLLWEEYCASKSDMSANRDTANAKGWAGPPQAIPASGSCRQREGVCRLFRSHAGGGRWAQRQGMHGADVRRRARRLELHQCRRQPNLEPAGLNRFPHRRVFLFPRRCPALASVDLLSQTDRQPDRCRSRSPLPNRHHSSAAVSSARQGQGRSGCPDRRATIPARLRNRHARRSHRSHP